MRALVVTVTVLAVYFGIVWLIVSWMRGRLFRRVRVASEALAAAGAKVGKTRPPRGFRQPAEVDFELDGTSARYQVRQYGRDFILQSVQIEAPPLPPMLVRAERGIDRLGKSLGLNREVQLGDATFDAAAYIDSAAPDEQVREALGSDAVRAQVLALLSAGYRVETAPGAVRATRIRGYYASFDAPELPQVLRALAALREAFPRFDPASLPRVRGARVSPAVVVAVVVLFVGIACFPLLGALAPLLEPAHGLRALGLGMVLWLGAVAALFFGLRGRPHGMQEWLVAAFALLFGLPPLFTALAAFANEALDHGTATPHTTEVLRLHRHDREVTFPSWERDGHHVTVSIRWADYRALHVGDTIVVETRPGALGWPWVSSVRRVAPGGP